MIKSSNKEPFTMPLSLRTIKAAIACKINPELIKELHFYDLQDLILSFNVDLIKMSLEQNRKTKLKQRGIDEIEHISGSKILENL